ncbi:MAG: outer membrane protein assembly factor BamE [Rhodobacteraceae bacterium]|nr:outer membrane protein assembly factor BamE [Paracoccaceae bacterium]
MIVNIRKLNRTMRTGLVLGLAFAVAACGSVYRKHGYVPTEEQLNQIQLGVDTRDTVTEAIGAPSSTGVLNESGYYYVTSRVRHYGAKKPEVVSRELVAINFNQSGVVTGVQRFGLEDGKIIPLQRRVTSSSIEDKTFVRQLLGNLGRFTPGAVLDQ